MNLGQGDQVPRSVGCPTERGYAMAALLVGLSIMAVLMSMALPVWSQMVKREKEEELIWRGQQYARAIGLFQRRYANTFPPSVDVLVEQRFLRKKYKDPITNDDFQPIPAGGAASVVGPPAQSGTGGSGFSMQARVQQSGQGQVTIARQGQPPVTVPFSGGAQGMTQVVQGIQGGQGFGIQGVVSKSKESSIKVYNGRTKYNEWAFVYLATSRAPVAGPQGGPGNQRSPFGGVQPPGGPGNVTRPPAPGQSPFQPPFGPGGGVGRPGAPSAPGGQPSPFGPPPQFPPPQRPPR